MELQTPTKGIRSGLSKLSVAEGFRTPSTREECTSPVTERSVSMATMVDERSTSPSIANPELDDPFQLLQLAMKAQERTLKKRKLEVEEESSKRRRIEEESAEKIRLLKKEVDSKDELLKSKDQQLREADAKIKALEERIQDLEKLARDMPRIEEICYKVDSAIKADRVKRKAKTAQNLPASSQGQSRH